MAGVKAAFAEFAELCAALVTHPEYAAAAVCTLVALAAGVYAARECATLLRRRAEQLMGRPALVRETSRRSGLLGFSSVQAVLGAPSRCLRCLGRYCGAGEKGQHAPSLHTVTQKGDPTTIYRTNAPG